jgi:hypothetical protein
VKGDGFPMGDEYILRRSLVIAEALCLIVTAQVVRALRQKHASGARTGALPDVMLAQVEQDVTLYSKWIGTLDGFVNVD